MIFPSLLVCMATLHPWMNQGAPQKYVLHNAFQLYKLKHLQGLGFCFSHYWFLSKDVCSSEGICVRICKKACVILVFNNYVVKNRTHYHDRSSTVVMSH
jgi:hypothetical protein